MGSQQQYVFNIYKRNHHPIGRDSLFDMVEWISAGLEEAGHVVVQSPHLYRDRINLIWEFFGDEDPKDFVEAGLCYGIFATEIPGDGCFNGRTDGPWEKRFQNFEEYAKSAAFIWTTVPQAKEFYQRYCPTSFVEFGYSPRLWNSDYLNEPRYDFGFLGLMNDYRRQIIGALQKYSTVYSPGVFFRPSMTAFHISKFRIGICLKQSLDWPLISPTRVGRLLHARREVAQEPVTVRTRQCDFIEMALDAEDFIEYCMEKLRSYSRENCNERLKRYSAGLPMRAVMEEVLRDTIMDNPAVRERLLHTVSSEPLSFKCLIHPEHWHFSEYKGFELFDDGDGFYGRLDRFYGSLGRTQIFADSEDQLRKQIDARNAMRDRSLFSRYIRKPLQKLLA